MVIPREAKERDAEVARASQEDLMRGRAVARGGRQGLAPKRAQEEDVQAVGLAGARGLARQAQWVSPSL
jgi:hypothetical protein